MKKFCCIILTAIIVGSIFTACKPKNEYHNISIEFPVGTYKKTEHNTQIFDIEPFVLHINIPANWQLRIPETDSEIQSDLWSPVGIYQDDKLIGNIGYNTFEYYPEAGDNPVAVYNQLMLGSGINWNNGYTPVKQSDTLNIATCTIARKQAEPGMSNAEAPVKYSRGILAHDYELLVYIGIDIDEGALTSEYLDMLVNSIFLERK